MKKLLVALMLVCAAPAFAAQEHNCNGILVSPEEAKAVSVHFDAMIHTAIHIVPASKLASPAEQNRIVHILVAFDTAARVEKMSCVVLNEAEVQELLKAGDRLSNVAFGNDDATNATVAFVFHKYDDKEADVLESVKLFKEVLVQMISYAHQKLPPDAVKGTL